ncbi:hypothetical protein [Burkholderia gladioli]|uniref:recombination directionality factor n=1 Tax=Burkholderia gladioli TaxID=28095 RepID=UPI0022B7684F|nr:hypothetical protein [Burkholderia gladioli]
MAAWGSSGRSTSRSTDPMVYATARRMRRLSAIRGRSVRLAIFGGRDVIFRQDDAIPDGICNPEQCPQYQSRQCNLGAQFIFAIPDIKGLGLIELPTNSIYVLQKAYAAMKTVQLARRQADGHEVLDLEA